jgi:hypothetical protein
MFFKFLHIKVNFLFFFNFFTFCHDKNDFLIFYEHEKWAVISLWKICLNNIKLISAEEALLILSNAHLDCFVFKEEGGWIQNPDVENFF